jgi:hypothetical protein
MVPPDPDQDLLNKLDRRQRRSEILSFAPAIGLAFAAGLLAFALLRFAFDWDAESALDAGGLAGIVAACFAWARARPGMHL